jgi:hypothetical protein
MHKQYKETHYFDRINATDTNVLRSCRNGDQNSDKVRPHYFEELGTKTMIETSLNYVNLLVVDTGIVFDCTRH